MSEHDRFEELCSLAAGGHLDAPQYGELHAHLRECPDCRAAYADFSRLVNTTLPQGQGAISRFMDEMKTKPLARSRERFLRFADTEGISFSPEVEGRRAVRWVPLGQVVAVAGLAVFLFVAGLSAYSRFAPPPSVRGVNSSVTAQQLAKLEASNARLQAALAERDKVRSETEKALGERGEALADDTRELNALRAQADAQARLIADMKRALNQSYGETQTLQASLNESCAHLAEFQAQIQSKEQQLAEATNEVARLRQVKSENDAALVGAQYRVAQMSEELRVKEATLDMEKELLAAGRDVRDIMGARQLHLIDVHDSDSRGKEQRVFGRIFYTEGKQLVLYAFDLNEKRLVDPKHWFQVWGHKEGVQHSTHSLGFLIIDDKAQKRWAMKVNDPALLKEMDSVFVTMERGTDGRQPTGQHLLYAYLDKPNHP